MKVGYDSGEEAVALRVFDKRRNQKFMEALIVAISNQGGKVADLMKEYRGELFVEYAYDAQKFLLNSKKVFERIAAKFGKLNLVVADSPGEKKKNTSGGPVVFVDRPGKRK